MSLSVFSSNSLALHILSRVRGRKFHDRWGCMYPGCYILILPCCIDWVFVVSVTLSYDMKTCLHFPALQKPGHESRVRHIHECELDTMPNMENVATLRARRPSRRRADNSSSGHAQPMIERPSADNMPSSTGELVEDNVEMASLEEPGQDSSEGVPADADRINLSTGSS